MKLKIKPVFIIGSPRSGTTFLLKTLASNTNFTWISHHVNNKPKNYHLVKKLDVYKSFFFGKRKYIKSNQDSKEYPCPCEPWNFWNYYFPYFQWKEKITSIPRNPLQSDISEEEALKIRKIVEKMCEINKTEYFLSKYTDFPRIQLMKKVFPNAKFIHLVRDGRAVANSYSQKILSGEFKTSKEEANWANAWKTTRKKSYYEKYKTPLSFTLYQWMFFIDEILNELKTIHKNNFISVKYSDLVANTEEEVQKILKFVDLEMDTNMKYFIKNRPGQNMNKKWQQSLTNDEKMIFNAVLEKDKYKEFLDF